MSNGCVENCQLLVHVDGPTACTKASCRCNDGVLHANYASRRVGEQPQRARLSDFLRLGGIAEWQIGYNHVYNLGRHICSRFVTAGGTEDSLTSPRPTDTDFASLIEAHLQRAIELMQEEVSRTD